VAKQGQVILPFFIYDACFRIAGMTRPEPVQPTQRRSFNMKTSNILLNLFAAATLMTSASTFAQENQNFPVTELNAGINLIKAEVATTPAQHERGLMYRDHLGPNDGMVFIFDKPQSVCMWMKNTLIPLSVAFMDEHGVIVNIEEMKAQTLDTHCAKKDVAYALEMNPGWFARKNIKPGTKIDGITGVK
jgi:uncharacterized membrane protein (UPF0127 family)